MSSSTEHTHWRLQLNNLLQRSYGVSGLDWESSQHGPQHAAVYEVVTHIRGMEYGRGRGRTVSEAKEIAAQQAYYRLFQELYGEHDAGSVGLNQTQRHREL